MLLSKCAAPLFPIVRASLASSEHCTGCLGRPLFARQSFRWFSNTSTSNATANSPVQLPLDKPIEEEIYPLYKADKFYNAHPGDVLNERFKLISKLGCGSSSTVWFAQDLAKTEDNTYGAIKIMANDRESSAKHEIMISDTVTKHSKPEHLGALFIRNIEESFVIESPNGKHTCLLLGLLRDPLWLLKSRLKGDAMRPILVVAFKEFIRQILHGLNHLHTECGIIHTDLTRNNIMVSIESYLVFKRYLRTQLENPMARKTYPTHTVYQSHNNFGQLDHSGEESAFHTMVAQIIDFGEAAKTEKSAKFDGPIQSNHSRAPEVILGCGWSYSVDIWSFGTTIWELLAGEDLFQQSKNELGDYSARYHLAEMISLLGPIPEELIEREKKMRNRSWGIKLTATPGGTCYDTAAEFYGGPFFDESGNFVFTDLIPKDRSLEASLPKCITDGQKDMFLDFMKKMLHWLPEERATAAELLDHPWLTSTGEDDDSKQSPDVTGRKD